MRLTPLVHDRDAAGMTYVYPVVSRRSRGVSVGINLNPNRACNWRCVYCQVPDLVRGKGPPIDLALLEEELDRMLAALVSGDYMLRHVPEGSRRLNDVAFSGNGEPTSSPDLLPAVELVRAALARIETPEPVRTVLITNGSLVHLERVRLGLEALSRSNGEVWFKLDSATDAGMAQMNDATTGAERSRRNLIACAGTVRTWVQTMMLARAGQPPAEEECRAYLECLEHVLAEGARLEGVLLYGLARRSYQPEAAELSALPPGWMEGFARRIRSLGLEVRVAL